MPFVVRLRAHPPDGVLLDPIVEDEAGLMMVAEQGDDAWPVTEDRRHPVQCAPPPEQDQRSRRHAETPQLRRGPVHHGRNTPIVILNTLATDVRRELERATRDR